jgi:hypothetical protein
MFSFLPIVFLALAGGSSAAPTPPDGTATSAAASPTATSDTKALFEGLFTAPSALDRYKLLLVDPASGNLLPANLLRSNIVFDYNKNGLLDPGDTAGKITAAVAETFPILVDQEISTVTAFLNPCSLLVPHTHPQIESLVVAQGTITTGTLIPGLVGPGHGTGEIVQNLTQFQGTVFPAGAIHYQLNPTCQPAVFISSLSSSDPGTTLESTFFSLSGNVSSDSCCKGNWYGVVLT